MKRWIQKTLCLAVGWVPLSASAQELNFRAVVPRPQVRSTTSELGVTIARPAPIAEAPVFRAKSAEEVGGIVPASLLQPAPALAQKDAPRLAPLPPGPHADFVPPAPRMIAPPPGGNPAAGQIVPGIPGGQGTPQTIIAAPNDTGIVTGAPIVSEGNIVGSSPVVSTAGDCVCSDGYSVVGGMLVNDCVSGCCGMSCDMGCGSWCDGHPFTRIRDLFACCNTGCCEPRTAFWIRGDYLLWYVTRQSLPALVSQAPTAAQLPLNRGGQVIYGNNEVPTADLNGMRASLGFWFPRHCDWGMDVTYFFIGNRRDNFFASSNGTPALGRPIIDSAPTRVVGGQVVQNPLLGQPNAQIVAQAGIPGDIAVDTNTRFWNIDANLRRKLCCGPNFWLDGLVGFRHLQLEDWVTITENIGPRLGPVYQADNTLVQDSFATQNIFNGGQVGLEAEWRFRPRWTLGGRVKVAAGNMHQSININGFTTLTNAVFDTRAIPGQETQSGGLLAQGTNIGQHTVDRFTVIPEVGVKLGLDITPHLRLYAGYDLMFISNVVRAGEQIDLRVNRSQNAFSGYTPANAPLGTVVQTNGTPGVLTPGSPPVPSVLYTTSEFWAQGVNFGLEYRY